MAAVVASICTNAICFIHAAMLWSSRTKTTPQQDQQLVAVPMPMPVHCCHWLIVVLQCLHLMSFSKATVTAMLWCYNSDASSLHCCFWLLVTNLCRSHCHCHCSLSYAVVMPCRCCFTCALWALACCSTVLSILIPSHIAAFCFDSGLFAAVVVPTCCTAPCCGIFNADTI